VFSFKAFGGGVFWSQLQMGLARGIYSNEAGMGTSSIVHVKTMNDGCQQGAWGILEVFLDTVVSCTLSALVVLLLKDQVIMVDVYHAMYDCFQFSFGIIGDFVYFTSMAFFAMAGMLAWCYYAQECLRFLRISDFWYPFFFVGLLLVGSFIDTESIWAFTDICNGCMLILNVSSMIGLYDIVINCTKKYFISKGYHVK
jgi:AGCS family alanine or glycine:cation symporter